ncbi:unnamed protein product [Eretmochelys imbricata]
MLRRQRKGIPHPPLGVLSSVPAASPSAGSILKHRDTRLRPRGEALLGGSRKARRTQLRCR